jgi:coenzyme F420 hydrogenase subunit beta
MLFPCTVEAGRCYGSCPRAEVDLEELSEKRWGRPYPMNPLGEYREILAAQASTKIPAGPFQAGGAVTALVIFALKQGLIESAVLTDRKGLVPLPRLATNVKEVIGCASSKYTAAPTLSAFNRAVREGRSRIGVVGTPCQILALTRMRSNPLGEQGFADRAALSIGLFCTWALDTRGFIGMASKRVDGRKVRKMDIPPPPAEVFVMETDEGRVEMGLGELRSLVPEGCLVCPDMTSEWADISVGVLEGEPRWNTVIVRTDLGSEIVDRAARKGWLRTREMPEESLAHLTFAAGQKKKRGFGRGAARGLLNTAEGKGRSVFRVDPKSLRDAIGEEE